MTTHSPSGVTHARPTPSPSAGLAPETPAPWVVPPAAPTAGVEWLPRTRPHRGI